MENKNELSKRIGRHLFILRHQWQHLILATVDTPQVHKYKQMWVAGCSTCKCRIVLLNALFEKVSLFKNF